MTGLKNIITGKLEASIGFSIIFHCCLFLASLFLCVLVIDNPGMGYMVVIPFYVILSEILVRLLFIARYGVSYKNRLYSPLLVDHHIYGYAFTSNFNTKKYKKLLYDNYLFRGVTPNENYSDNLKDRVIFTTNSLGYRGKEFEENNASEKVRIFCAGGSTTACDSCDDKETWPARLGSRLEKGGYPVEVINAGVQGWFSYQDLLKLKYDIVNHDPDVLILHQGWNEEFEYSSQNLGENWSPNNERNYVETNIMYSNKNRFLSFRKSLALHLIVKQVRREKYFKPSMSFLNSSRWLILKDEMYLASWFDQVVEIIRIAQEKNILVYMVDYPALIASTDTQFDRKIYIENSRLDRWFADYQSMSKERIATFLNVVSEQISVLDGESRFLEYKGSERLSLFLDEIHLSSQGNDLLAKALSENLRNDSQFGDLFLHSKQRRRTIDIQKLIDLKQDAIRNSEEFNGRVDSIIAALPNRDIVSGSQDAVPTDRYTTF